MPVTIFPSECITLWQCHCTKLWLRNWKMTSIYRGLCNWNYYLKRMDFICRNKLELWRVIFLRLQVSSPLQLCERIRTKNNERFSLFIQNLNSSLELCRTGITFQLSSSWQHSAFNDGSIENTPNSFQQEPIPCSDKLKTKARKWDQITAAITMALTTATQLRDLCNGAWNTGKALW